MSDDAHAAAYHRRPWLQHYPQGLRDAEYPARPLHELFEESARRFGDRPYLIDRGFRLTYGEAGELVARLAGGLARRGIRAGDRIGYCMANSPVFPILQFAAWRIGAVPVGFNPLYGVDRLARQAEDSGVRLVVGPHEPELRSKVAEFARQAGDVAVVIAAAGFDPFALEDGPASDEYLGGLLAAPVAAATVQPDDLAALCYTGGTTGEPKGVMLTHANLSVNAQQAGSWFEELVPGGESVLAALPFTHVAGLSALTNASTFMGARMHIQARFNPHEVLDLLDRRELSVLMLTPTMIVALLDAARGRPVDFGGLKVTLCGAAPLPGEVRSAMEGLSGRHVLSLYGMTETGPASIYGRRQIQGHPGCLGVPLPMTDVQIRDPQAPQVCMPPGEVGEIVVDGPQVMAGYWRRPEATEAMFVGSHLRTGDLGYMTEDGVFYAVDRLKDVIIAGGYNIYPAYVENAVLKHPAVAEVAVIGVPDAYRGETVKAYVRLHPGQTLTLGELQAALSRDLSPMEMPKALEILDDLPRTPNMKISREELRRRAAEALEPVVEKRDRRRRPLKV